jgi:uncharacterized damage-inducible protein DinB
VKHLGIAPLFVLILLATSASAQSDAQKAFEKLKTTDSPLSAFPKLAYGTFMKTTLLRSAEKMPEEYYNFRPAWVVRSFGQVIGHVADSQYYFCSGVLGDKNPAPNIQQTKTSKADLIAALKDSFAYCDKAYEGMTDASATQMVKFQGIDLRKVDVLTANILHSVEHYGNLVIYMRMKNIVPPSSEQGFMQQAQK